jgi:polyphosphate glucokinase
MPASSAGPAASSSSGSVDPKSPRVLVIDVGGTNVKILASGEKEPRKFPSGPKMTPKMMVAGVKQLAEGWQYDRVAIGYPGPVRKGRPVGEPHNVARGWVRFDFPGAFGCPVRMINDAAMQALGGYNGGKLLFLGLGTGLGTAMIAEHHILPMELAHLPFRKGVFEDYVGVRALKKYGKKKWRANVAEVIATLAAALLPDDIVLGGGNVKQLKKLPKGCRAGANANAFTGGFRLWEEGRHASATSGKS